MTRVLEPTERFSEVLFGLIMVLTFTCTLSVSDAGRGDVREMLVAALGCNLAWGIVDAVMYVINALTVRARGNLLIRRLRAVPRGEARGIISEVIPARLAGVLTPDEFESLRLRLTAIPDAPEHQRVSGTDLLGALYVFLLVFLSTFPVAIPFLFVHEPRPALRISNAVALVMLFLLGRSLARYTGGSPWRLGFGMLLLGGVLVALTIALGG